MLVYSGRKYADEPFVLARMKLLNIEPCPFCEWWKDAFGNWRTTEPTRWEIHTVDAVEGGRAE